MKVVNNFRINPNPCNKEDELANWQTQSTLNQAFVSIVEASGSDTTKVSVNATDFGAGGADYLHAKFNDAAAISDMSVLCKAETVSDATERIHADLTTVSNYTSGVNQFLMHDTDDLAIWVSTADVTGSDSFQVKSSATDSVEQFLTDKILTPSAYVSGADLICNASTNGGAGTEQDTRIAVDVSAISAYSGSGVHILGIEDNTSKYFSIDNFLGEITAGTYIDISGSTISFDHTEIDGWSDGELLGKNSGGTFTFGQLALDLSIVGSSVKATITFDGSEIASDTLLVADILNALGSYDDATDQSIGHDASGSTMWQEDGDCS